MRRIFIVFSATFILSAAGFSQRNVTTPPTGRTPAGWNDTKNRIPQQENGRGTTRVPLQWKPTTSAVNAHSVNSSPTKTHAQPQSQPTKQRKSVKQALDSAVVENSRKDVFTYDSKGNNVQYVYHNWDGVNSQWEESTKHLYDRDEYGNKSMEEVYSYNSSLKQWEESYKDQWVFDAQGNELVLSSFAWDGNWYEIYRKEAAYNAAGNETMKTEYHYDYGENELLPSVKDSNVFDATERVVFFIKYSWDKTSKNWINGWKEELLKDINGIDSAFVTSQWNGATLRWDGGSKDEYSFSGNQKTMTSYYWDNGKDDWEEAEQQIMTFSTASYEDDDLLEILYYNWNGTAKTFDLQTKETFFRDANNSFATTYTWDDLVSGDWSIRWADSTFYNPQGQELVRVSLYWSSLSSCSGSKYEYTYTPDGDIASLITLSFDNATNDWANDYRTLYQYDGGKNRTLFLFEFWNGSDWEDNYKYEDNYNLAYDRLELLVPWVHNDMTGMLETAEYSDRWGSYVLETYYWSAQTVDGPPTYTVEGNVTFGGSPLPGVTIACSGYSTTTTDAAGEYRIVVDSNASVTLTATMAGYRFLPPTITINNVSSNLTDQDFEAIDETTPLYTISGKVTLRDDSSPLANVTINNTGGYPAAMTNVAGEYIITVDSGVSVTLTASAGGYSFSPASIPCNDIQSNLTDKDFVATEVGIIETHNKVSLQVYPNPTNGQLRITYAGTERASSVQMYDVVGQRVFVSALSSQSPETTIDISHLAAGLYFLKIDDSVIKIMKD